jgi:4-hydroxyacetophenone monooxygenase
MPPQSNDRANPFARALSPIIESDAEIAALLADVELPPLLPALAHLTGDLSLLDEGLRPDPLGIGLPQGGLSDEQQEQVRLLAVEALGRLRNAGTPPHAQLDQGQLLAVMEFAVGGADMAPYLPLLEEELALDGTDQRAPAWTAAGLAAERDFDVLVIGAGMSGLLVAHRLQQAGVGFVVLEKDREVGGTWWENVYPGCRVDNPNHNYSYSFAQRHDWPWHYSTQPVLAEYFRQCADAFALRPNIRFETEVLSATWHDDEQRWTVVSRGADGRKETHRANAVVSAVGQLNRPSLPAIPGRETFTGPAFHSASWDHTVDLHGKRVAVIGTGASAVQFAPEIAPDVAQLVVFQRTPPWLGPTPDYHEAVSAGQRWLYEHLPGYSEWNRFWIFWRMGDGVLDGVRVDPDWAGEGSVSAINDIVRLLMTAHLENELADRPDLLAAMLPPYPPAAKRILRDNGIWPRTMKRDNVTLCTEPIERITPQGVVTADGTEHQVDVLIFGTGFEASHFLTPMTVIGRDGIDLHRAWGGDARAYLGVTVPGFPNFFMLYGPNTNIVINGSIIYFSECGTRYILDCLRLLLEEGHAALEVRTEVHDAYNEQVDAENARMAWGASDVNSWYKNERGRITQNWPFTLLEYWRRTRTVDPDEYVMAKETDRALSVPGSEAESRQQ